MIFYTIVDTPLGQITVAKEENGLKHLLFPGRNTMPPVSLDWIENREQCSSIADEILAYFAGELKTFSIECLPVGSAFQQKVWKAMQDIPYGTTVSYQDIARIIGNPKACRAVGGAAGANPIPIVIPCHRVVGKDGSLTGFGSGLHIKKYLLDHERRF